jgi:hypothetical protein
VAKYRNLIINIIHSQMIKLQELLNKNGANLKADGVIGPKTTEALANYIANELKKRKWLPQYHGIVWLRTDDKLTNKFDDFCVVYKYGQIVYVCPASTTAGDFYVYNPLTVGGINGTAVATEQQVVGSHRFVTGAKWSNLWLGAPYFQQILPITIYRDGTKDRQLDQKVTQFGLFGINFHRAGLGDWVNKWSAGCQVVPDKHWFEIVKRFNAGQTIDFTLFCTFG